MLDDSFPDSRIPNGRRSLTKSVKLMRREHARDVDAAGPTPAVPHPATRGECEGGCRPCPLVGCRWNLYLDVSPETGSIKFNFPGKEVWELETTCALDVADEGEHTLDGVAAVVNLTRERVRQMIDNALRRVQGLLPEDVE